MARISTYAVSSPAELTDELVGSDINKATKNFTVQSIVDLSPGFTPGTRKTLPMFLGVDLVDSPISVSVGSDEDMNVIEVKNVDRFIIDKPSRVVSGDPEYLITQDSNPKVSMGWDDDGAGFGYLYNWAGNGWRFGSAGNNPELTIVTTSGSEGVVIANGLSVDGPVSINGNSNIGNAATDLLQIISKVSDSAGSTSFIAGQVLFSNPSGQLVWGNVSGGTVKGTGSENFLPKWSATDTLQNSIIFDDGNTVGIGTSGINPQDKLHVMGTIRSVVSGGNGFGFLTNRGTASSASGIRWDSNNSSLILNDSATVVTTKISSSGFSWFDGGAVGFGTKTPAAPIEMVVNDASGKGLLLSNVGDNSAYDSVRVTYSGYGTGSPECIFKPKTQPGAGIVNTYFRFKTNGSASSGNIANVTIDGKVGIGTTNDVIASQLTVGQGDIEITKFATGLILRSNNGTRYRITVANDGTLTTTAV